MDELGRLGERETVTVNEQHYLPLPLGQCLHCVPDEGEVVRHDEGSQSQLLSQPFGKA